MSAAEYCEGREYTAKTLKWWASKLDQQVVRTQRPAAGAEPVRLARVVRMPSVPASVAGRVTVHIGTARVEVPNGIDCATLAVVFQALGVVAQGGQR